MAENTLVKETLTPEMIEAGKLLIETLENQSWPIEAAFWFFEEGLNRWKLYVSSPSVEAKGPREAYNSISRALGDIQGIELADIVAASPGSKLVRRIVFAVDTGGRVSGVRFTRNSVNGFFIEDAYIYKTVSEVSKVAEQV